MPSPSPISALTVQPARSTVGAALRPLPGFGVNRDFFFLVVSQYPVSIDSYPIKHRGHTGLSLGLMSPLFDGEPIGDRGSRIILDGQIEIRNRDVNVALLEFRSTAV